MFLYYLDLATKAAQQTCLTPTMIFSNHHNDAIVSNFNISSQNDFSFSFSELTLPQFYSFLHEMEKAKASLEYLT